MARLERENSSPAVLCVRADNCQLVDDQARDVKLNRLQGESRGSIPRGPARRTGTGWCGSTDFLPGIPQLAARTWLSVPGSARCPAPAFHRRRSTTLLVTG